MSVYFRHWLLLLLQEQELALVLQHWHYGPGGLGWPPLQGSFAAVSSAWLGQGLQMLLLLLQKRPQLLLVL